jgi:hypothetical protein
LISLLRIYHPSEICLVPVNAAAFFLFWSPKELSSHPMPFYLTYVHDPYFLLSFNSSIDTLCEPNCCPSDSVLTSCGVLCSNCASMTAQPALRKDTINGTIHEGCPFSKGGLLSESDSLFPLSSREYILSNILKCKPWRQLNTISP